MISKIPFTHRVTSSLICRITGDVMDEHNPPYLTKHNQVFSEKVSSNEINVDKLINCYFRE